MSEHAAHTCLDWRKVCSGPLPIWHQMSFVEFQEFSCQIDDLQICSSILLVAVLLWIVSLNVQNFKVLLNFSLPVFPFVACAVGVITKKSLPNPISQSFCPVFSSKSLMSAWNFFTCISRSGLAGSKVNSLFY